MAFDTIHDAMVTLESLCAACSFDEGRDLERIALQTALCPALLSSIHSPSSSGLWFQESKRDTPTYCNRHAQTPFYTTARVSSPQKQVMEVAEFSSPELVLDCLTAIHL